MEMKRDFIGYARSAPQFEWPNGGRLALNIVVNYEEGAERSPLDGDTIRERANEVQIEPASPDEREFVLESIYEYGSRVGVWRLFDVFDAYSVRPTIFAVAVAVERNPVVAEEIRTRAYDIVGHGYRWFGHFNMSEAEERDSIRATIESLKATTGSRIVGWFTRPPQTSVTRAVLAEEGFLYDSGAFNDDLPYYQDVRGRPFLVVPYSLDVNDIRFWKNQLFTADDFADYCIDSFDALYAESRSAPRMMSVGLHPRIIGRPGRVRGLTRFLDHVRTHSDVWIASRTEIATYFSQQFAPADAWTPT